jgi:2-alkenal reductase
VDNGHPLARLSRVARTGTAFIEREREGDQFMHPLHDASRAFGAIQRRGKPFLVSLMVATVVAAFIAPVARVGGPGIAMAQDAPVDPVAVAKQVGPAVVTVLNEQQQTHLLRPATEEIFGAGSGFFIDEQGHIATNNHVVEGGDTFEVVLADGSSQPATLVGADPISDLAVLQVTGSVPAVVTLGDSSELAPGQPVLAIGSPLGAFTNTVTGGIVSAIGRSLAEDPTNPSLHLTGLIQHDASINPGNSGGPLVDMAGEVVGVNTLALTDTGESNDPGNPLSQDVAAQGLFFAIPANTVKRVTTDIIATGHVAYPYLGLGDSVDLTPEVAHLFHLPVEYGLYVDGVEPNSPAAQAGIQDGDIIVAVDGTEIGEEMSLTDVLFTHKPGDTVQVTVTRDGGEQTFPVTLGTAPTS